MLSFEATLTTVVAEQGGGVRRRRAPSAHHGLARALALPSRRRPRRRGLLAEAVPLGRHRRRPAARARARARRSERRRLRAFADAPLDLVPRSRVAAAGTASCAARREPSVRIGCSGWNYAHWRNGVFYPPRLPASKWLDHYAQFFDTVEVNATFYRLPKRTSVARWVEQSPPGFVFAIKSSPLPDAHQAAERPRAGAGALLRVHRAAARLAEARADPLAAAAELQARRRAAGARARAAAARSSGTAFEFRQPSWFHETVRAAARASRRARDRRPARGARVPVARADGRLDVRALPLGNARAARQLQRDGAARSGPADRELAGRRLRVLQQRLGGLRAEERVAAESEARSGRIVLMTVLDL